MEADSSVMLTAVGVKSEILLKIFNIFLL